jgi:hypothetical protein
MRAERFIEVVGGLAGSPVTCWLFAVVIDSYW